MKTCRFINFLIITLLMYTHPQPSHHAHQHTINYKTSLNFTQMYTHTYANIYIETHRSWPQACTARLGSGKVHGFFFFTTFKSINTNYLINETYQKYFCVTTLMGIKGNFMPNGNPICYEMARAPPKNILKRPITLLF